MGTAAPQRSPVLTDDMKRVVSQQRLGFVATVCPDGTPNLSPKGTTAVWDDEHLGFRCRPHGWVTHAAGPRSLAGPSEVLLFPALVVPG